MTVIRPESIGGIPADGRRSVLETFYGAFPTLRPIQEAAFRPIHSGEDVVICSGTGSGKTEAVIAPIVDRLFEELTQQAGIAVVYICPTKALINDLYHRLEPACRRLGINITARHGDIAGSGAQMRSGILVTTPESLDVLLGRGDSSLDAVRVLAVDEAHLFYNTQRGLQLRMLMRRLRRRTAAAFQSIAMSATIASPQNLVTFLFDRPDSFRILRDETVKPLDANVQLLHDEHQLVHVVQALVSRGSKKVLVFANSRRECDALGAILREGLGMGPSVHVHHSSLSPALREEVEQQFSTQPTAVCVATSTLELGIDIGDIDAVVLYGAAPSYESFLQRIGRGSRRVVRTRVICLVPPTGRPFLQALVHLATLHRVELGTIAAEAPFDLVGAAAQQVLSYLHERQGTFVRAADFADALGAAPHLPRAVFDSLLRQLASDGVVKRHGFKNSYGADDGFFRLESLRLLFGNYPASATRVPILSGGREIGRIDGANLLRLEQGTRIRFAGKVFEVRGISRTSIDVRPARPNGAVVELIYPGGSPGIHPTVLADVFRLITDDDLNTEPLSAPDAAQMRRRLDTLRPLFANNSLPCVHTPNGVASLTFGGALLNRLIAASIGAPPPRSGDVAVIAERPLRIDDVRALDAYDAWLGAVADVTGQPTLFQTLLPRDARLSEMREALVKTPSHGTTLQRLRVATPRVTDTADALAGLI